MAIDLMVMSLSRYFAGDFVTPTMRAMWAQGVPYKIIGPEGVREMAPGVPFGGPDAAARRAQMLEVVKANVLRLAHASTGEVWDEATDAEPAFTRLDPRSATALFDEAQAALAPSAHLLRTKFFLPLSFDALLADDEMYFGSVPTLQRELAAVSFSMAARAALDDLSAAAADAVTRRLPLIIDM